MKNSISIRSYLPLFAVYVSIIGLIVFRVTVHPTYYTTPDSIAYLNQAEHIKENWLSPKGTFTTWPIGYPLFIATISQLSSLSVLVSSKLVNLLFLGGILVLLFKWFKNKSWFVALLFCTYGLLEIISQTWTETSFTFFWLLLIHIIKSESIYPRRKFIALLSLTLIALFLCKYVAVFVLLGVIFFMMRSILNGNKKMTLAYAISLTINTVFIALYLYDNFRTDGFLTGESRLESNLETFSHSVIIILKGVINEAFWVRKHYASSSPNSLFYIAILLQVIVGVIIVYHRKLIARASFNHQNLPFFILGLGYLLQLIIARLFIPLYDFDYRLLSPFTIPILIAIFGTYLRQEELYRKTYVYVFLFLCFSFVMGLPKTFILSYF